MSFVNDEYVTELATRPDTVVIAKAIHAAWCVTPDLHSCDAETEPDWYKIGEYSQGKFLLAADQAIDSMHWTKIALVPK